MVSVGRGGEGEDQDDVVGEEGVDQGGAEDLVAG